jgi:hypothetical protein
MMRLFDELGLDHPINLIDVALVQKRQRSLACPESIDRQSRCLPLPRRQRGSLSPLKALTL